MFTFDFFTDSDGDGPAGEIEGFDVEWYDTTNTISLIASGTTSSGARAVDIDRFGIGVDGGSFDNDDIDGSGPDETLWLDFGMDVRVLSITLENVTSNDDGFINLDATSLLSGDLPNSEFLDFTGDNYVGSVLSFGVLESNDDYKVRKVKIYKQIPDSGSTFILMGLGLTALAFVARRKIA